jgi:SAM-dependent methyltransferase
MLATGDADRERLEILAEIYEAPSEAFLRTVIDGTTSSAVDIGCGHGQMVRWLSRNLPPDSEVVGLDSGAWQLALCEAHSLTCGPDCARTTFWHADITERREWARSFDLVYSRFVLLHIADWDAFFTNVLSLCRPGGDIVLEEPAFPFFAYPVSAELNRANELGTELAAMRNLRFDCAPPLWAHLHTLGLEIRQVQFYQPTLVSPKQKMLLYHSFAQIREPLLAAGLTHLDEFNAIARAMRAMAHDPTCVVGGLRLMQVHLCNAAAKMKK